MKSYEALNESSHIIDYNSERTGLSQQVHMFAAPSNWNPPGTNKRHTVAAECETDWAAHLGLLTP